MVFLAENGEVKPLIIWFINNVRFQKISKSFLSIFFRNSLVFAYLLCYLFACPSASLICMVETQCFSSSPLGSSCEEKIRHARDLLEQTPVRVKGEGSREGRESLRPKCTYDP